MLDVPYTTPDEDPFRPLPREPRRRRSSLLSKWIHEQQQQHTAHDLAALAGYDLIDDDDIPPCYPDHRDTAAAPAPPHPSRLPHRAPKFLLAQAPFRNPFRASSSPPDAPTPRLSRFSFLPRSPRSSTDTSGATTTSSHHTRSSSLSTVTTPDARRSPCSNELPRPQASPQRWRPTVLDHFSPSQTSVLPSDTTVSQSRPSMSSADTYTSGTPTSIESDLLQTPSNITLTDPIRYPGSLFKSVSGLTSSSSLWSQKQVNHSGAFSRGGTRAAQKFHGSRFPKSDPPSSSATQEGAPLSSDVEEDDCSCTNHVGTVRVRGPDQPQIAYSASGTLRRVNFTSLSSRQRKKKKLVVSGVGLNDSKKFEGVKRWCESFGEVSQIIRMPNGDLHVHFRLAEVADTVCRLRAKVHIAGVGSVQLSWFVGDKR